MENFVELEPSDQGALVAVASSLAVACATVYGVSRIVHEGTRRLYPNGGIREKCARAAGTAGVLWLGADALASYPAPPPFTTLAWVADRIGNNLD